MYFIKILKGVTEQSLDQLIETCKILSTYGKFEISLNPTLLLSPTFETVVMFGVVLVLQKSASYKSSKIVLLESLQMAALIPLADHIWSWVAKKTHW